MIGDPDIEAYVSAISLWEIAIKYALSGKRRDAIRIDAHQAWTMFDEAGFTMLPVEAHHAAAVDGLPKVHADPFDRLLVAQAIAEPMRLATRNRELQHYTDLVELV